MATSGLQSRKLRVFAFDPSLGKRLRTARANEIVIAIPAEMERAQGSDALIDCRGPIGNYLEVVDYDPASDLLYEPIDLDTAEIIANHGLSPSEANPQFHQQMVYAVAMATIATFEDALGRVALWSSHVGRDESGKFTGEQYVGRLRIYPHAFREANAYYSPEKKALLFGYFAAGDGNPRTIPGSTVFTCLSHDIVAHETTHALLDGMHSRFIESTNSDVLALHEAFADIVAIFQHFSYPEVLEDQIAKTRGDLESENLLGQLAQEFGQALGRGAALRDALGDYNADGVWRRRKPNRRLIAETQKPHGRGAILVAAVFDSFLAIYSDRTRDLLRIATAGTGSLPPGDIHPDLVKRLAHEAAKAASHLCRMCIRALDYCPPVDVTFGDYLRAIITADYDLFPEDERGYRTAIIESFSAWGIVPDGLRTISVETLLWPSLEEVLADNHAQQEAAETSLSVDLGTLIENPSAILEWIKSRSKKAEEVERFLHKMAGEISDLMTEGSAQRTRSGHSETSEFGRESRTRKYSVETLLSQNLLTLGLEANREVEAKVQTFYAQLFWAFLTAIDRRPLLSAIGLTMEGDAPPTVYRSKSMGVPTVEVHSVRMATRRGNRNQIEREYVVEVTQRRRGYLDLEKQKEKDAGSVSDHEDGDFRFRRGCTLLIDARTFKIRRVIRTKGDVSSDTELERVRTFVNDRLSNPNNSLYGGRGNNPLYGDDFAHLHRSAE